MIGTADYPSTGLRQRFNRPENATVNSNDNNDNNNDNGPVPNPRRVPVSPTPAAAAEAQQLPQQQQQQQQQPWRTSHVYCFVSAVIALLAIVTSAASPSSASLAPKSFNGGNGKFLTEEPTAPESTNHHHHHHHHQHLPTSSNHNDAELVTTNPVPSTYMMDALDTDWWRHAMDFLFSNNPATGHIPSWLLDGTSSSDTSRTMLGGKKEQQQAAAQQQQQQPPQPWWKLTWIGNHHQNKQQESSTPSKQQQQQKDQVQLVPTSWWQNWLDTSLFHAKPSTVTDLIDKVLTSTPRLLAIANLLLALTYQMHTAVADWFLGVGVYPPPGEWAMTGRERLGSFLVFKLLLISAVVTPDTLDLLILLSWYTLLSFLRSLAHLAAATTSHTTQSGQPPRAGVLQLLLVILLCDFIAAAVCVALFQLAGFGMVLLLTCDCALLAVEVLGHILKHVRQVLEDMHERIIAEMEEQQLQIHARQRRIEEHYQHEQQQQAVAGPNSSHEETVNDANNQVVPTIGSAQVVVDEEGWDGLEDLSLDGSPNNNEGDEDDGIRTLHSNNHRLLQEDSRRLDQAMDGLELAHARRLAVLDTTIFVLQLLVHAITVGHFLHIWYLHGIQFTLIDGVLALHLHSALSAASKQIAERRNLHRIARNLDGAFENASELDLKIAHAAGDVCCICLGLMSVGSVKKVGCGHLYHTNCLREVIERAHSIEAAKCPLCRASVVDGSRPGSSNGSVDQDPANGVGGGNNEGGNNTGNGGNQNNGPRMPNGINHRGERALFRFSTEGILPTWMPLPAFSFEVVRRPTRQEQPTLVGNTNSSNTMPLGGRMVQRHNVNGNNVDNVQQSFLRRLLLLAGAVPMSPEEEARALTQLVDMFPQYDRADLLRELRDRGSAESVVESVLLGVFSGRVRGSAGGEAVPARANNPTRQEIDGDESAGNASLHAENPPPSQQQIVEVSAGVDNAIPAPEARPI